MRYLKNFHFPFRDDSFSIVMYDTQGDNDININQEILKAVQQEAETSLLTSSGSNPQSTESSPLPLRRVAETTATTATSSASSSPQTLSPKRQPQTTPTPVLAASEVPKSKQPTLYATLRATLCPTF